VFQPVWDPDYRNSLSGHYPDMSADPKLTEVRFHIWWDAIFPAPPIQKMWKLRWV